MDIAGKVNQRLDTVSSYTTRNGKGWCVGVGDSSPTNGPVVQRLARPSGIRETRGSIPGLAFSFLLPHGG